MSEQFDHERYQRDLAVVLDEAFREIASGKFDKPMSTEESLQRIRDLHYKVIAEMIAEDDAT